MKKAVMQLETLTCPSCMKKIEGALDKVEGVENVKVLFNASKAKVDFDEAKVSTDELKEIVEKTGYQVQTVKTN
ncbi:heavy metal-associated domain-containing protein [Heyndrickxia coagulans]|uniref:Copper chaperone CopZ n=1 Tax=Heyndrickxia coagulans TaxID=1398 RepID=A0AAW7CFG6_HEYCO|nr:heavy metal-associated domain-containing protein [Heyndrickxia coagulans]AEH52276.1 Heavy metal transport/detoxification protein [Heyndrickxia coagulans 2-6]MDL5039564.1 heavy metal-associated domain-containing protein [Heyndrickxia coagulans]